MGFFSELAGMAGKAVVNTANEAREAQERGRMMGDSELLRYFKNSTGAKKLGMQKLWRNVGAIRKYKNFVDRD